MQDFCNKTMSHFLHGDDKYTWEYLGSYLILTQMQLLFTTVCNEAAELQWPFLCADK